ncbi:MAG: hypothetical protein IE933_11905 [Sphingomonadales bacterium]|nr:hypothetical protein [Sphingomonadales bacterium]MBD3774727.1 hypothetical protein [Paracoccaceae bacterium]
MDAEPDLDEIAKGLRKLSARVPRSVATRISSTLNHFEKSHALRDTDLEMASFRAICGEEEAAAAVISALYHRKYPNASGLNIKNHQHKWAIVGCMLALSVPLRPILGEFQLQMDFAKGRIDVKIPLSNFGVRGGERVALQPVEPLDLLHYKHGKDDDYAFEDELAALAEGAKFKDIKDMVAAMANSRNRLLYASDTELPKSEARSHDLDARYARAITLLVIAVMILQSKNRLSTVKQALPAVLTVIGKLPVAATS